MIFLSSRLCLALVVGFWAGTAAAFQDSLHSFHQHLLPHNEQGRGNPFLSGLVFKKIIDYSAVEEQLVRYAGAVKQNSSARDCWLNNNTPGETFGDLHAPISFQPFVQKLVVSAGSEVFLWGDIHGSVHSLIRGLRRLIDAGYLNEQLQVIRPNTYLVFLGDYVDRGVYGIEVIYILLKLKSLNPDTVVLVRGNHEDADLNAAFGFFQELCAKYPTMTYQQLNSLYRMYDMMPVAVYLGCGTGDTYSFVQCCHGGMELGFNPLPLLQEKESVKFARIERLHRQDTVEALSLPLRKAIERIVPQSDRCNCVPLRPTEPSTLGFMWGDFTFKKENPQLSDSVAYEPGRGMACGKALTQELLARASGNNVAVRGVIRAHQHNRMYGDMLFLLQKNNGLVQLWDGMVYTLFNAPALQLDTSEPMKDSLVKLTLAHDYASWHLAQYVEGAVEVQNFFK